VRLEEHRDAVPDPSVQDPERRLWFDFLAKLNDRSLQGQSKSGATNWVLLGVAAAIIYKCVPLTPTFLATPGSVKAASVLFFLEVNAFVLLLTALVSLQYYSQAGTRRRLLPEGAKRVVSINAWVIIFVEMLVGIGQLWLGFRLTGPRFARWTLVGFGLFWVSNAVAGIVNRSRKKRRAKAQNIPVPQFSGLDVGPDLGAIRLCVVSLLTSLLALVGVLTYLRFLGELTIGWVTPLGAATQVLVLLSIIWVLFYRIVQSGQNDAYLSLERAILAENLTPSDIRTRFVTELLGDAVGDWMKAIGVAIAQANENLGKVTETIRERLPEIGAIDSQYGLERRGRAEKLLKELAAAMDQHRSAMEKSIFHMEEYRKLILSAEEQQLLQSIPSRWVAESSNAVAQQNAAAELLQKLKALT
jgi:hypothetical protein